MTDKDLTERQKLEQKIAKQKMELEIDNIKLEIIKIDENRARYSERLVLLQEKINN